MKNSGTLAIFSGVVSFIIVWILVSQVLEMRLMGAILDKFISVGFLVLVILFQDEIRFVSGGRLGSDIRIGSSWEKYFEEGTMTRRTKGSLLPRLSWPA